MIKQLAAKLGLISLALFVLGGPAWSQDQNVSAYLKEIDSIQDNLKVAATAMKNATGGLKESIRNGTFDPAVINGKLASVKQRMMTEQDRLRLLAGPEPTKNHQYHMDQQITTSIKMLDELPPMLLRTRKLLDLFAQSKATDDPAAKEKVDAALKVEQDAILGHQASVKGLNVELNKFSEVVESERSKLDKLATGE